MALECLKKNCTGKVYTGARGRQFYWRGEKYSCRKCGAVYIADVTDDYADDCLAFLVLPEEFKE